jgi:hypothetical protein
MVDSLEQIPEYVTDVLSDLQAHNDDLTVTRLRCSVGLIDGKGDSP